MSPSKKYIPTCFGGIAGNENVYTSGNRATTNSNRLVPDGAIPHRDIMGVIKAAVRIGKGIGLLQITKERS